MPSLKVATFNVNSVKSRMPVLQQWLSGPSAPDVICLQETKCQDADFPVAAFAELGYKSNFKGMKSYNGVAVISRTEPDEVSFGLGDEPEPGREESELARVARVRFGSFNIIDTYVPQGKEMDNPDFPYKLRFFKRIRAMFERNYKPSCQLLWVGDLNVAPTDIDVTHPENKKDHVCFTQAVKDALYDVELWGLVDIFRQHRPDAGEFTFWDYRVKDALNRNIGWRIDHLIGTKSTSAACTGVVVERSLRAAEKPSDHTAVVGTFEV